MKTTLGRQVLAIVAATSALAGCAPGAVERPGVDSASRAVSVIRVGGSSRPPLVLPARVGAREEITLRSRMEARLTALPVREGGSFRQGQVLAIFDAPESRAQLDGAHATLAAATLARDLARKQEARMDSLWTARVAALREYESAQTDRQAAEAAWAQARSQLVQMQSAVTLVAPFAGVVARRHVDPGATVGSGEPLLDLRSTDVGEILASVPESELDRLADRGVEYQVDDGAWSPAVLVRVDGMTDFSSHSRIARFRPRREVAMEPGAFARVRLHAGADRTGPSSGTFTIPVRAIVRRGELTGVFVVEAGIAGLRWLRVGRENATEVEVLAGLETADSVVWDPAGLRDGQAVRVLP